ncbi:hypothetical protein A0J61_05295 [Choanephora cucurbitarum]|uniref:Uncharacterized protein n=1 Tax=Choanephora cucurbitarum TaxID=101091 RepID=A0A1C7NC10_9FUNG|nr:hypothetical protein A0J61_05295 [Choanephora cucurbitarum]
MMNLMNMMNTWRNEEEDEVEDDDEEEQSEKKRKRKIDHSENDVLLVVKMLLDTIFGDTKLKWKSGEKTTDATKRARIVGQLLSRGTSCSNLMGRRSDLVLYNKSNVVLCLSELKDGNSESNSIKQEAKSLRCSKSLLSYNKPFSQKDIWSLDWNGFSGYTYYLKSYNDVTVVLPGRSLSIPLVKDSIDDFEDTLIALYEFKEHMLEYDHSLSQEFTASMSDELKVYHSP